MNSCQVLSGYLEDSKSITGILNDDCIISGSIEESESITGELENVECVSLPEYDGSYEVIPKTTAQTLQTQGTQMAKDISVLSIPIYITENQSNGNTIYIG